MSLDLLEACPRSPLRKQASFAPTTPKGIADTLQRLSNVGSGQRDALIEHDAKLRSTFDHSLFTL